MRSAKRCLYVLSGMILAFVFCWPPEVSAASRSFSKATQIQYAQAAQQYWQKEWDNYQKYKAVYEDRSTNSFNEYYTASTLKTNPMGPPNKKKSGLRIAERVDCDPFDVKLVFYNDDDGALARAYLYSASKGRLMYYYGMKLKDVKRNHCRMFINTYSGNHKLSRLEMCVIFIHEYGHMLGFDHNKNIKSVMYDGYVYAGPNDSYRQYAAQHRNVLANSICSAVAHPR